MKKIFAIISVPLLLVAIPSFIKIGKIECTTQYGECPSDLTARIKSQEFQSLRIAKKEINKILQDNLVSDFSTQFKLPNTLKVVVLVKQPLFAVNQESTTNFALVSAEGLILGISDQSSLPQIVIQERIQNVGERVSEKQLFGLNLISGVLSMYQIQIGKIKDGSLLVDLPGGINVIFPLEGDRDVLLGSLRMIYTKIQAEEGKYREIDLRFVNPVLR